VSVEVDPIPVALMTWKLRTWSIVAVATAKVEVVPLAAPQVRFPIIAVPAVFGVEDERLSKLMVEVPSISEQEIEVRVTGTANWCLRKLPSVVEEGCIRFIENELVLTEDEATPNTVEDEMTDDPPIWYALVVLARFTLPLFTTRSPLTTLLMVRVPIVPSVESKSENQPLETLCPEAPIAPENRAVPETFTFPPNVAVEVTVMPALKVCNAPQV